MTDAEIIAQEKAAEAAARAKLQTAQETYDSQKKLLNSSSPTSPTYGTPTGNSQNQISQNLINQGLLTQYKKQQDEATATYLKTVRDNQAAAQARTVAQQQAQQQAADLQKQKDAQAKADADQSKLRQEAGTQYTTDIGNILAGQYNYRNAADAQQAVVQQSTLGGWSGVSGALAGQQQSAQLDAQNVLQDRSAEAQDIFATNSAVAQKTAQAVQQEFTLNQQAFDQQLGYSQQFIDNANQALEFATGEQKLKIQTAIDKYQAALTDYANSAKKDQLDDKEWWDKAKLITGALVAVASAVAIPFTGGASAAGVGAGIGIAKS